MSVKLFKLNNGEEFISEIVSEDMEGNYNIDEPMVLINNGEGVSFYPWMISATERKMTINKNQLMFGKPLGIDTGSVKDYKNAKDHFTKIRIQRETGIVTESNPNLILS